MWHLVFSVKTRRRMLLWAGETCNVLSFALENGIVSCLGVFLSLFSLVIPNRDVMSSAWKPRKNKSDLLNDLFPTEKNTCCQPYLLNYGNGNNHSSLSEKIKVCNNNVLLQSLKSLKSVMCCLRHGNIKLLYCCRKHVSSILFYYHVTEIQSTSGYWNSSSIFLHHLSIYE